jgi:hypothetical protein
MRPLNILLLVLVLAPGYLAAEPTERKTLFNFDEGSEKTFPGWEWMADVTGYGGSEGWTLVSSGNLGIRQSYLWGDGARNFNKGDYGSENSAIIDTTVSAPATSGGSFKVFETELSTDTADNRSTWWVWYDGVPLSERSITSSNTNRMSFYLLLEGLNGIGETGGTDDVPVNFHIGTYLCWNDSNPSYGTGDGCPYEGVGNQHYYHYLNVNPGGWIHVLLDQHPTHKRELGGNLSIPNNPAFASDGKNYYEQMHIYYMEIREDQAQKTAYWLDEIEYYFEDQAENEESVTSVWVGYWSQGDYFEVGLQDASFALYNDDSQSSFEIRWSDNPITNSNYSAANKVSPLFYSGVEYSGSEYIFRRPNSYRKTAWTRFKIDDMPTLGTIYFAIKDVSVSGGNTGTKYPWNRPDGHNAASSKVKTIAYNLSAVPNPPTSITVTTQ